MLIVAVFSGPAQAAPGDLDVDFGADGISITKPDAPRSTVMRDLIRLSSGDMLAVGGSGPKKAAVIIKLHSDGSIDKDFGDGDGVVLTPDSTWAKVIEQTGGKLVVSGRLGKDPAIARFNADGTPDPTFGDQGSEVPNIRPLFEMPNEYFEFSYMDEAENGDLVVTAYPHSCLKYDASGPYPWSDGRCPNLPVYRFSAEGQPDLAFGDGAGHLVLKAGRNTTEYPVSAALDGNGSMIVRSSREPSDDDNSAIHRFSRVQRFNPDGNLDEAFGVDGSVRYDDVIGNSGGILITHDGKILVTGGRLIRLLPDGSFDESFGKGGKVPLQRLSTSSGLGSTIAPAHAAYVAGGRVILAGSVDSGRSRSEYGIRLGGDDLPDPTFANDGLAATNTGESIPYRVSSLRLGISEAFPIPTPNGGMIVGATGKEGGQFTFTFSSFEGGTGKRLSCHGQRATVQGTPGNDVISGGSVTVTGGGDDRIEHAGGLVCAGPGKDVIEGGQVTGPVFGEGGSDRLRLNLESGGQVSGGPGNDHMDLKGYRVIAHGDVGNDDIDFEGSESEVHGDAGDDWISGGSFHTVNRLFGDSGRDRLTGGDGVERLYGGPGGDYLRGMGSADVLRGDAGDDILLGGGGPDRLFGGAGRDRLDAGPAGPGFRAYGTSTDRVRGTIKISGNRVATGALRIRERCVGTRSGFETDPMFDEMKFNRRTGRFTVNYHFFDGFGFNSDGVMKGRVTNRSIVTRYQRKDDFSYGDDGSFICRVDSFTFRLKRQTDPRQTSRQ